MNPYYRWMRVRGEDEARVAHRILDCLVEPEGCWHWQMATTLDYGRIKFRGRLEMAHRVSYLLWVGDLITGMQIDHLCRNRWCVNPHHLEQVTPIVNQRRSSPRQQACKRGHPLVPSNVYIAPRSTSRSCRACQALRQKTYKQSKVAA